MNMTADKVKTVLSRHMQELRHSGVRTLALFGSVARGDAAAASDIDLLIEFDRPVSLFAFFDLQHRLESLLGVKKVDLVMPKALRPELRERILSEAVNVA